MADRSSKDGSIVTLVNKETFCKHVHKDREKNNYLDVQRYNDAKRPHFQDSLMLYFGKEKSKRISKSRQVQHEVETFVLEKLMPRLSNSLNFKGNAIPCGSVAEGVKVGKPNEFDYILEACNVSSDDLVTEHVTPDTFEHRTMKESDIHERSYFQVKFRNRTPENWEGFLKCSRCNDVSECDESHQDRFLSARSVQKAFVEVVRQEATILIQSEQSNLSTSETSSDIVAYASTTWGDSEPLVPSISSINGGVSEVDGWQELNRSEETGDAFLTQGGPAVSVYISTKLKDSPPLIKIDLTFAIPFKRRVPYTWPLAAHSELQLNENIITNFQGVDTCHLIPCGDYWRVTFVTHEKELMCQLMVDYNKKYCFQAMKSMRDDLAVTDDYEKALLSSYPLKVSFLKEYLDHKGRWERDVIGPRAVSILGRVADQETTGQLTSYYIKNDPILPGNSDRSHIEGKRILHKIEKHTKAYGQQGCCHAVFWVVAFIMQMTMCISSGPGVVLIDSSLNEDMLLKTLPVAIAAAAAAILACTFAFIWITASNFTVIYGIFKTLKWTYATMLLILIGQLTVCALFLDGLEIKRAAGSGTVTCDKSMETHEAPYLPHCNTYRWLLFASSLLLSFLFVCHFLLVMIRGHERCRCYTYPNRGCCYRSYSCCEVVFYDALYTDLCSGCRKSNV